jgi:hypothetical protein
VEAIVDLVFRGKRVCVVVAELDLIVQTMVLHLSEEDHAVIVRSNVRAEARFWHSESRVLHRVLFRYVLWGVTGVPEPAPFCAPFFSSLPVCISWQDIK